MYPTPTTGKRKRTVSFQKGSYRPRKLFKKASKKRVRKSYMGLRRRKNKKKFKSLSGLGMKKVKVSKLERYGIHCDNEWNGVVTTTAAENQFGIIGHVSAPYNQTLYALSYALTKAMATKMGIAISSFDQAIETWEATNQFSFRYQATTNAAVVTVLLPTHAAPYYWRETAADLYTQLQAIPSTSELIDMSFVPGTNTVLHFCNINLQSAKVNLFGKSELRLQNASVPADALDDTADEVDAVALVGKTFTGSGNGTAMVRSNSQFTTDVGLWGQANNGMILRAYTDTQALDEIPRPEELINVSKCGKIIMPPGSIQASRLKLAWKGNLNRIFRLIKETGLETVATGSKNHVGSYAIHMFQKAIETTPAVSIKVLWQIHHNFDCVVYPGNPYVTTQKVLLNGVPL